MFKTKKFTLLSLLAFSVLALTGCDTEYNYYPEDYDDPLFPEADKVDDETLFGNTNKDYYDSVLTSDTVYANTVTEILKDIAEVAHDYTEEHRGTNVSEVINDTALNVSYTSVMNTTDMTSYAEGEAKDNLRRRAEDSMVSNATNDSYVIDNEFYERKFTTYLESQMEITLSDEQRQAIKEKGGQFILPDMTFDDIFTEGVYDAYMEKNLYDDNLISYLTAEYIYTKNFNAIGNTNARKVQIAAITDRSDAPGSARNFLNAYLRDYVYTSGNVDEDFSTLSRLWKGITKGDIWRLVGVDVSYDADFSNYDALPDGVLENSPEAVRFNEYLERYGDLVLTKEDVLWLRNNGLISANGSTQNTLAGKVYSDQVKLENSLENYYTIDTDLESQYTGSNSYDYRTGVEMAYDDIAQRNFITDGVQLASDGLSGLPDTLKSRIFQTRYAYNKDDIEEMRAAGLGEGDYEPNTNLGLDITQYCADGNRYLTFPGTASDASSLLYYDSSSTTYYLVRILDVVTNSSLGEGNDSVYDEAGKREQIAREVAYAMANTGTYKNDATIYWLRRTEIDYSDEDFLEYMKSNYQDLFRTSSSNDGDATIVLED